MYEVEVEEQGEYTFNVTQQDERIFPRQSGYEYSPVRCFLLQNNSGNLK